jgi:hypothetical protein
MYSVPVRGDSFHNIGELKGILRYDGQRLTLQYQLAHIVHGDFRTAPVDLDLPAEIVVTARYRSGFLWLKPAIELQVSDIAAVSGLPAEQAGRLYLRVPSSERRDARKIVDGIIAMCAEQRIARLDASLERMTSGYGATSSAPTQNATPAPTRQRESE